MSPKKRRSALAKRQNSLEKHRRSSQDFRHCRLLIEPLEDRRLLSGSPIILSEILAGNNTGITTSTGAHTDWLEVSNTSGQQSVNLNGWQLKYSNTPTVWTFPAVTLGPGESRVIFCDSATATDPNQELHTNFNLGKSGKNLTLVDNTGTVISSYTPYPAMNSDISYGVGEIVTETKLVAAGATAAYYAPTNNSLGTTWTQPGFDDTAWASGPTGLGFTNQVSGFAVTNYKANTGGINNVAQAQAVVDTPSQQSWTQSETIGTINFLDTGGNGNFGNDNPFPGMTVGEGLDVYAVQATGTIHIPAAGQYTFGVNSDDGFSLSITGANFSNGSATTTCSGNVMADDTLRGASNSFGTATFSAAGDYPVTLLFYENYGDSSLEFFAASGSKTAFDSTFRLVGDTANGGLAVKSAPFTGQGGNSSLFSAAVQTNVQPAIQAAVQTAGGTSLYTRIKFDAPNLASLQNLTLKMQYDDGYIAYLNGVQIASRNAGGTVAWNALAPAERTSDVQDTTFENVDISQFLDSSVAGHLMASGNVLAIQVLLASPSDGDLLVVPEISQMTITTAGLHFFAQPSPGSPNLPGTWQPDLTFSKQHGFYSSPFQVTLATSTVGASIYYTTDNSTPSGTHGTLYTLPISISTTTVLRAVSVVAGGSTGVVSTESYIFTADVIDQPADPAGFPSVWGLNTSGGPQAASYAMNPQITDNPLNAAGLQQDLLSLPTVSIVTGISNLFDASQTGNPSATDNTGIYSNVNNLLQNGVSMEVPASFEYFSPDGSITLGQLNIGLQIEGGVGRYPEYQKHSFRINFSSDYGPSKLNYPLFADSSVDSFNNIVLRSGFNDAWTWAGSTAQYMRDVFAAETQLAMGEPGFHTNYVFLYVDGLFWGLYMMDERPDANFAASSLGGTAAEWEANNAGHEVNGSSSNLPLFSALQNFGSSNDLTTLAAYEKIQGNNPDGTRNPAYTDLLDMTNYADYLIMEMYIGNTDWPWHNWYAADNTTADSTGFKFFSWDAEWSMGLQSDLSTNMTGAKDGIATVYAEMMKNPEFDLLFADRVRKFMFDDGALTPAAVIARYQNLVDTIQAGMVAESARWGSIPTSSGPLPNTQAAWLNEAAWVTGTYMPQRTSVVLAQFRAAGLYPGIDAPEYNVNGAVEYGGAFNPGDVLTLTAAGAPIYYTLDGSDPRLLGGALNPNAIRYTGPIALAQGVEVKSRIYSGGVWSALSDAGFYVNLAPSIRITELMYNPPPATAAEIAAGYNPNATGASNNDFEYIEIENIGTQTLPLQGMKFTNGVTFTFPNVSLAPNQHILVVANLAAFQIRYSGVSSSLIAGQYTGHLDNAGEEVQLTAPGGGVIQDFTYNDAWYGQTDGEGFSLTIRDPLQTLALWNTSAGWEASGAPQGTPGTGETTPIPLPGSVVINEVLANPASAGGDMIELYNTTAQPINVGGWWLGDSSTNLTMYQIAANTTIAAGGYLVLTDSKNYGPTSGDPGVNTPFALSKYGFSVHLSSNAGGVAGGYQEFEDYGSSPAGISVGRLAKSTGGTDFVLLATPTFGSGPNYAGAANNSPAYVPPIDINELMYDPSAPTAAELSAGYINNDDFEFIELYNRSDVAQPLSNFYLGDGVGFTFGWIADGTPNESATLESGATATWTTSSLTTGTFSVYADYSLTDPNGAKKSADEAAQYSISYPGGSFTAPSIDQNTAVNGKLFLGTITLSATGSVQVRLTRGSTGPNNWTMAGQIEFVKTGQDLTVGNPSLNSFATAHAPAMLAPGAYVVLVANYAAFDFRYHVAANNIPVVGVYSGRQNNGGELISLFQTGPSDPLSGYIPAYEIDRVKYDNGGVGVWPTEPTGGGPALIRVHTADYGNDLINWQASNSGGTPGTANVPLDPSPPTVPANLTGHAALNPNQISLNWTASSDSQSYVDHYVIYRNGASLAASPTNSYIDSAVQSGTNYSYAVSAVNRDGYASAPSAAIAVGLPGVSSYDCLDNKHLEIFFNEPLTASIASVLSHYAMTGGITFASVALSRDNTKVTLATNQVLVAGNSYTVTMNGLTTASGNQLPSSLQITFTYTALGSGSILEQYWAGIGAGNAVSDLTGNPNYPNNPTSTSYLSSFEVPSTGAVDYGERVHGYIYPPTTGSYVFWIASDDNSQLWLSTDDNPANAVMIAYVSGATGARQWTAETTQQSVSITLVAGHRYYIEALQKQGGGGENLAVAWQLPGTTFDTSSGLPIPGIYLSPYGGGMDLTPPAAPANLRATVSGGNQVNLTWLAVSDVTSGIDHYVIYRDGVSYGTSTTANFTDSTNISSRTRHSYQVAAVNYDGIVGAFSATISPVPAGIASITTPSTRSVQIQFTEPVDAATAQLAANYHISGMTINSAVLQADKFTVILTTTTDLGANSHTLTINNVLTRTGNPLGSLSGSFTYASAAWAVTVYQANWGTLGSLANAQSVVSTPAYQSWVRTAAPAVINYAASGASGNFGSDSALPGLASISTEVDNYVITATGMIYIPAAGIWTFDCDSDDGFSVTIAGATFSSGTNVTSVGGNSFAYDGGRGATDSLGVANFPAAGYYPISLLFFQGGGPSGVELSAASGSRTAFSSSLFHLIGDMAHGGLALGGAYAPAPFNVAVNPLATGDPTPALSGTVSDPTVAITVRVAGNYYAVQNNNGAWSLPEGAVQPPLSSGSYDILVCASNAAGQTAFDATTNELTIDTTAPTASIPAIGPENTPLGSLAIQFSEPVNGFNLQDLRFTRDGISTPLGGATLTSADNIHWTLGNLAAVTAAPGNYVLTVIAAGSNITDLSGNVMANSVNDAFVIIPGIITGTSGNDVFRIVRNAADTSKTDIFINNSTSTPDYSAVTAGLATLDFAGMGGDDTMIVDFSNGNPLPAGGLIFDGGSHAAGDKLVIVGASHDDNVTLTGTAVILPGMPAITHSNVEFFAFDLGGGDNSLLIDHATLNLNRDNDISAGTKVTVNGGILNFNGHSNPLGNLTVTGGGQVIATAINNTTTTVASGTLTAVSIVCDTLTIGTISAASSSAPAANSANAAAPLTAKMLKAAANYFPALKTDDNPVIAEHPISAEVSSEVPLATRAASVSSTSETLPIEPSVILFVSQAVSASEIVPAASLAEQSARQNTSPQITQPLLQETIAQTFNADAFLAAKMDNLLANIFAQPTPAANRPNDSADDELTASLARMKTPSSTPLSRSENAHDLALVRLMTEFPQNLKADQEDSEMLIERNPLRSKIVL